MSKKKHKKPTSPAVKAANQANAQKSTGPKTPEGKAASSQNSSKHGLCSQHIPMSTPEDQALFDDFQTRTIQDFAPQSAEAEFLVRQIITLSWQLSRVFQQETTALNKAEQDPTADPSKITERYRRYYVSMERMLTKTKTQLENLKQGLPSCAPPPKVSLTKPVEPEKPPVPYTPPRVSSQGIPIERHPRMQQWEAYRATLPPEQQPLLPNY